MKLLAVLLPVAFAVALSITLASFAVFVWLNLVAEFGLDFREVVGIGGLIAGATANISFTRN